MAEVRAPTREVATEAGAPVAVLMAPATADEAVPTTPEAPLDAAEATEEVPDAADDDAIELAIELDIMLDIIEVVPAAVELPEAVPFVKSVWRPERYAVTS